LWTQAREGLDVTTILLNNRKYQILQVELSRSGVKTLGPHGAALTELRDPVIDWAGLARSLGVPASRPANAESFYSELQHALEEPGPH